MKHFRRVSYTPTSPKRAASLVCAVALFSTMLVGFPPTAARGQEASARAQQATPSAKRALTHQDYDSWRSIAAQQVSRDGKFVAYAYIPQDGDGQIIVRNIATGVDWRAPRGYRPPAPPPDDPGTNVAEFQAEQARLLRPVFTADSRFLVFGTEPTKAEVNKAKKEKRKPEEMPKNGLGIMDLSTGAVTRIERVKTFRVPEDGSGFIAYLLEPTSTTNPPSSVKPPEPAATNEPSPTTTPPAEPATSPTAPSQGGRSSKKKEYGSELVLRNTLTANERKFSDVLDFTINKNAKTLVFTTSSRKEETNGAFAVATENDGPPTVLLTGKGKYQRLTGTKTTRRSHSSATKKTLPQNNQSSASITGT